MLRFLSPFTKFFIQISTNATNQDYHRSISTWHTFVIRTPTAPTRKDRTTVAVGKDMWEMETNVMVRYNNNDVLMSTGH